MASLLTLDRVTAGFVPDIDILQNVSLEVAEAGITGLIGLNGAGKSTIMRTICGFLKPKSGRVIYNGDEIAGIAPHSTIARGIWYIPQESSLYPRMSVSDNLWLPLEHLRRCGILSRDETHHRVDEATTRFPVLKTKWSANAGDLSGGQQKLVEFAKAFVVRPRLCLIDEPSIGLSPKVAGEIYECIDAFVSGGMTVLLVDHNVRRVVRTSHHIYVLSLGQITASGSPADFAGDLHEQVKSWLGIEF